MLTRLIDLYARTPQAGQRRAIAVNLVVFFLFALTAVVLLTRTAVAANAINRDVASAIEPATHGIDKNIKRLPVLDTTVRRSHRIAVAATPLSGHLTQVVDATDHINANLASTNRHVASIGASVNGIKDSTGSIRPAVAELNGHVDTIHDQASGIAGSLGNVAVLSSAMVRDLNGTNASLARILAATAPLHATVGGINATLGHVDASAARIENSPILLRNLGHLLGLDTLLGNLIGGH